MPGPLTRGAPGAGAHGPRGLAAAAIHVDQKVADVVARKVRMKEHGGALQGTIVRV